MRAAIILALLALPAAAATPPLDFMDYFVAAVRTCVAVDPAVPGSYSTAWRDSRCPGRDIVIGSKGASGQTWGVEIFDVGDDYIRLIEEANVDAGTVTSARIFYRNRQAVGIEWAPRTITDGVTWSVGGYADPRYPGLGSCQTDPAPPENIPGRPFPAVAYSGTYPHFLFDNRSGTPTGPFDIDIVTYRSQMGPTMEGYVYGRWTDPLDGQPYGLGLVGFMVWQYVGRGEPVQGPDWNLVQTSFARFLVTCEPMAFPCYPCPTEIDRKNPKPGGKQPVSRPPANGPDR